MTCVVLEQDKDQRRRATNFGDSLKHGQFPAYMPERLSRVQDNCVAQRAGVY